MKKLYPLKFKPSLKSRVWGGSRLVEEFGRVPEDSSDLGHIGESWDLSDMGETESVVANGFLEGNDIADILETYLGDLVGDEALDYYGLQFPLLIKILDIDDILSVQVHPDDKTAAERYDCYGKVEFWYVLDAKEDACVYMGFERDVSASEFYEKCLDGTAHELLNVYHPKKGDCFLIEPGTVHAAGGGILLAEIQESSDITFRLYDWGRENNPATAREMHLEEAIDCIDYKKYDMAAHYAQGVSEDRHIFDCEHFSVTNVALKDTYHIYTEKFGSCIIYICTEGSALIQLVRDKGNEVYEVRRGELILIPASMEDFYISPKELNTNLLEVHIPKHRDVDEYVEDPASDGTDLEKQECGCGHHHGHDCGCGHDEHCCDGNDCECGDC